MDFSSLVLMEKDKETGFITRKLEALKLMKVLYMLKSYLF